MRYKTLLFILLMALLGWMFTSMFFWTLEKNRAGRDASVADAPPSRYQRVLGLDRLQWDALDLTEQKEHLLQRQRTLEALPEDHPDRQENLPELYYWLATVFSRTGDGGAALDYLDRAGIIPGSEDWYYLLQGAAYEAKQEPEQALDSYLASFSYQQIPVLWAKLQQFQLGPDALIRQTHEKLIERSRPFPDFALHTPEGAARSLTDYAGRVVLVTFFFPG